MRRKEEDSDDDDDGDDKQNNGAIDIGSIVDVDGVVNTGASAADASLKMIGTPTKHLALDCEMVGAPDESSMLARVTVVNAAGECVFDSHVAPTRPVADYRTAVSGVRAEDLRGAPSFGAVQLFVANMIKQRTLVGHSLEFDLAALRLRHPPQAVRDTAHFRPLMRNVNASESLKALAARHLGRDIQSGEHDALEDARAAMDLYQLYAGEWEAGIKNIKALHAKQQIEREKQARLHRLRRQKRQHEARKLRTAALAAKEEAKEAAKLKKGK